MEQVNGLFGGWQALGVPVDCNTSDQILISVKYFIHIFFVNFKRLDICTERNSSPRYMQYFVTAFKVTRPYHWSVVRILCIFKSISTSSVPWDRCFCYIQL